MSQITTTLNEIRRDNPCEDGWRKLLHHLGKTKADDEPFPMSVILDSNGLDDCLWALRCRPDFSSLWRLYAVDCARQVQSLMKDQRSIKALDVAERHALGHASGEELETAWVEARAAVQATARKTTWSAAYAAAKAAAWVAEQAAAKAAVWAAAQAVVWAAERAALSAGWTVCEKQSAALRQLLNTGERPDWSKLEEQA